MIVEHEPLALPGLEGPLTDGVHVLALELDRGVELEQVGAGYQPQHPLAAAYPGNEVTVIEAHDELGAHRNLAAQPLDEAHDIDARVGEGHEVDELRAALRRL